MFEYFQQKLYQKKLKTLNKQAMKSHLLKLCFMSLLISSQSHSVEAFKLEDCIKDTIKICTDFADNLYDQEDGEQAIKFYSRLCDLDVGHGCRRTGLIHESLFNSEPQLVQKMYSKSCSLGDMQGCTNLGILFDDVEEYEKAREYYDLACSNDSDMGCNNLAVQYEYGNEWGYGIEKDLKHAAKLYTKSCNLGFGQACRNSGDIYYFKFESYRKSLKWYKKGCALNDGVSCFDLGTQYDDGEGVKTNVSTANELYKKACELNYIDACSNLARAYMHYDDITDPKIKKDYDKGVELLTYACQHGGGSACSDLSYTYLNGIGVKEDYVKALEIAVFGCDEIHDTSAIACSNAAYIYKEESSAMHDLKLAKQYYKKACDEGFSNACDSLEADEFK